MRQLTLDELKDNERLISRIKWDMTPEKLWEPLFPAMTEGYEKKAEDKQWYMFYIEIMNNKPFLMLMNTFLGSSVTVGLIEGIPEDLLKKNVEVETEGSKAGMYAVSEELKNWLKKELGLI